MATIVDKLLIAIGVDTKDLEKGLDRAQKGVSKADAALNEFGNKGIGMMRSLLTRLAAPIAGAFAVGKIINSYTSDVANVARMTGAYSQKLEEWKYKRAMLSRITKEDIDLYKKSREALVKFNISMQDLSAKIMRETAPAVKFFVEKLNKFSDWVDRNQNNIIRFLKVVAAVITTALIPAFIKLTVTMLRNPLTWLIMLLGGLALVLDDLIVYLHGGKSKLDEFWKALGLTKGDTETLAKAIAWLKDEGMRLAKTVGIVLAAFAGATAIVKTINLIKSAVTALNLVVMANPIVLIIYLIIAAIALLYTHWDEFAAAFPNAAKKITDTVQGIWEFMKTTWDTICDIFSNVIDFVSNVFSGNWSGAWENIKNIVSDVWNWISDLITGILDWILGFFGTSFEEVKNKVVKVFNDIWDTVTGFFTRIADKIRANHAKNQAQFRALVKGIKNVFKGITGWFKKLWKKITGVFSGAVTAIKNKIKSFASFLPDWITKKLGLDVKTEEKVETPEKEEKEKEDEDEPKSPREYADNAYDAATDEQREAAYKKIYGGGKVENDLDMYYALERQKENLAALEAMKKERAALAQAPAMNTNTAAVRNSTTNNSKTVNDNRKQEANIYIQGNPDQSTVTQIQDGVTNVFSSGANAPVAG